MANTEFTRTEFRVVLRMLNLLNSSLVYVAQQLKELSANKLFSPGYIKKLTEATQEVEKYLNKTNSQ